MLSSNALPDKTSFSYLKNAIKRTAGSLLSNGGITASVFFLENAKAHLDTTNEEQATVYSIIDTAEKTLILCQAAFNSAEAYLAYKNYKRLTPFAKPSSTVEAMQVATYIATGAACLGAFANNDLARKSCATLGSLFGYSCQVTAHIKGQSRKPQEALLEADMLSQGCEAGALQTAQYRPQ